MALMIEIWRESWNLCFSSALTVMAGNVARISNRVNSFLFIIHPFCCKREDTLLLSYRCVLQGVF